jgi:hypothetical protein
MELASVEAPDAVAWRTCSVVLSDTAANSM